ncbi:MAG: TPM domain-containing protein [Sphingomonadaceae bacterium]
MVDEAGLLYPREMGAMTKRLGHLEAKTGHQVAVAIVPSLQGRSIENFSLCLAKHWGLGHKGINNGVLMTVAPKERSLRIEVGYGLEKSLTNAEASAIIEQSMMPAFRKGLFNSGIEAGIEGIASEIGG